MISKSSRRAIQGRVAVSGNVYYPPWQRFARLPDGFAAPSDKLFVAAMFIGLLVYLMLVVILLACGLVWLVVGGGGSALRRLRLAPYGRPKRPLGVGCSAPDLPETCNSLNQNVFG